MIVARLRWPIRAVFAGLTLSACIVPDVKVSLLDASVGTMHPGGGSNGDAGSRLGPDDADTGTAEVAADGGVTGSPSVASDSGTAGAGTGGSSVAGASAGMSGAGTAGMTTGGVGGEVAGSGGAGNGGAGVGAAGGAGNGGAGGGGGGVGAAGAAGVGGAGNSAAGSGDTVCVNWLSVSTGSTYTGVARQDGTEHWDGHSPDSAQFLCRASVPTGGLLAIGKAVPSYGCFATYVSAGARVGFQNSGPFDLLTLPADSCHQTWQSINDDTKPANAVELGAATQTGLYACRGMLVAVSHGSTTSGVQLGQLILAGTHYECWTQFHDDETTSVIDGGSQRITPYEVLIE